MASQPDDALLTRYLIGQCSDDEQERVEQDFFTRDDAFDRLCDIEEELIGRYQRGELPANDRAAFERAFRSGPRRERALLEIALNRLSKEAQATLPTPQTRAEPRPVAVSDEPAWRRWLRIEPLGARLALAGATLALAIAMTALASRDAERQSSLERAQREADTLRQQATASGQQAAEWQNRVAALEEQLRRNQPSQTAGPAPQSPGPVLAAFVLTPGLARGSRTPTRIVVPQTVELVRLQLVLEGDPGYRSYRAEIRTAAGDVVWSEDGLQRSGSASAPEVSVTLSSALLTTGEHELVLRGHPAAGATLDEIASYFFTIPRR